MKGKMMDRQTIPAFAKLLFTVQLLSIAAVAQMPALSQLPQTPALSQPANPTQFTFVLAGDNRPAHSRDPQSAVPGNIFCAVQRMNPPAAFVLWTGDTISGKDPQHPKRMHDQYKEFLGIAARAGVPVFNAPGNHEMDDSKETPSKTMKDLYKKYMAGTYGAFSYGNTRFIALDSENEPSGATKSATTAEGEAKVQAPGAITKTQLKLLKEDLDANKNMAHVIIFMHHPVKPYEKKDGLDETTKKALEDLFTGYKNVSYVISGHEHMYFNHQGPKDQYTPPPARTDPSQPPTYLVSGGAGAPLKGNTPGSFFHYLVFTVNGNLITPSLIKVPEINNCTM
jgi:3',5'-cyclic AMP phosphodiesterase CpdA